MAFWTLFFEVSNIVMFISFAIYLIIQKRYRGLSTLFAGSIFGVLLEFINVYVFNSYYYSQDFFLQVGGKFNIPIVIGLAWGILLETVHEISKGYKLPILFRSLFDAAFVVSVDFFLDVVSVRLNGGFWTWKSVTLDYSINGYSILGIPWGNYFGWFMVIFYMSIIIHFMDQKKTSLKWNWLVIRTVISVILAEIFLFVTLLIVIPIVNIGALWLLFLLLYFGAWISFFIVKWKLKIKREEILRNWLLFVFYAFSYGFCVVTMITLGIARDATWYFILNIIFTVVVLFYLVYIRKPKSISKSDH